MHCSKLAQGPPGYVVVGELIPIHQASKKMQIPPTVQRCDFSGASEEPERATGKKEA